MNDQAQKNSDAKSTASPQLQWLEGDVPRAEVFEDTYFSKAGGLAETHHVFLGGNNLPHRFAGRNRFTVAEFGFGTGLNFLATLQALNKVSSAPHLTFLSLEMYPMTAEQLSRALAVFPDLAHLMQQLLQVWSPKPGWNRMKVAGADLLLGIGDARALIRDVGVQDGASVTEVLQVPPVDAWYFDGFSPARNPELWQEDLLKAAADLCAPDGTCATYTAAGWVRRNLQAAGFAVEKVKGFAGKREMVVGRRQPVV